LQKVGKRYGKYDARINKMKVSFYSVKLCLSKLVLLFCWRACLAVSMYVVSDQRSCPTPAWPC